MLDWLRPEQQQPEPASRRWGRKDQGPPSCEEAAVGRRGASKGRTRRPPPSADTDYALLPQPRPARVESPPTPHAAALPDLASPAAVSDAAGGSSHCRSPPRADPEHTSSVPQAPPASESLRVSAGPSGWDFRGARGAGWAGSRRGAEAVDGAKRSLTAPTLQTKAGLLGGVTGGNRHGMWAIMMPVRRQRVQVGRQLDLVTRIPTAHCLHGI
jgi:hypothetical protein